MKAIIQNRYGGPEVLELQDIPTPEPTENRLLVKVQASSINAGDYRQMRARPLLLRLLMNAPFKPKNPRVGSDVAGVVAAVGETVTQFRPGDLVFGCAKGAFAEYVMARETYLAPLPAGVTFATAAATPVAALTALQGLRNAGGIRPGMQVLIQGATGGVGSFAVQLAKVFETEVTAVCSPRNLELVRALGADHVIDYTTEDFTRRGQQYDLILAVNGYHSLAAYKRALKPKGVYVCAGGDLRQFFEAILLGKWHSRNTDKKLTSMGIAQVVQADLIYLGELLAAGKLTPHIDRAFPLSAAQDAMRYVEDSHAQGKVVITLQ